MKLKDVVVFLTGASDGLGKELALVLAKEGARLVLLARTQEKLAAVGDQAQSLGAPQVGVYPCDVSNLAALKRTVNRVVSDFGQIDVLINNAGIWHPRAPAEELAEGVAEQVIGVNLIGLINCTRLVLPELKKRPQAAIINVCSRSGVTAQVGQSIYSASKWGVRGYTEVLKEELKNSRVRVAGLYQGGTRTNLFAAAGDDVADEKLRDYTDPADLAQVVLFMLKQPDHLWMHDVRVDR